MIPEQAIQAAILTSAGGAALALLAGRARAAAGAIALAASAVNAVLVLAAVATVIAGGGSPSPVPMWTFGGSGVAPRLHVDGLAAVFLALAAVVALAAAIHSIGYVARRLPPGVAGRYHALVLLFVASVYGLVSTDDMMWVFCGFWQLMTLPGFALIRLEGGAERARAALRYLVLMEVACAAAMIATAALVASAPDAAPHGGGGRYDLEAVSAVLPGLLRARPGVAALAFGLFLAAFGIKAGMWPFGQAWLPDAHPAAPSPVSALLSGVMIKTGIYGLLRTFLWLVPPAAAADFPLSAWGAAVAVLGTVTLLTGTMQALRQHESKRLLAYSSIGQIGYVLLAAGASMAVLPAGGAPARGVAALALLACLFHVVNHGVFKSLLFLDAGSMLCATDTLQLDRMGGLARLMPVTAATALVASFAIAGVPLLNGFASKWMLYAAVLQGGAVARYLPLCAVLAILTSALTLACFVQFFGAGFLSRASSHVRAEAARRGRLEVGWTMQAPQVALAAACVVVGLFPALVIVPLQRALAVSRQGLAGALAEGAASAVGAEVWPGVALVGGGRVVPIAVLALLVVLVAGVVLLARAGGGARRAAEPWLCGYVTEADCYRYGVRGLFGELKRWFRWVGGEPPRRAETDAAARAPGEP